MARKDRIDKLLVERGLVQSRERAKAIIMEGRVTVEGNVIDKAGTSVDSAAEIQLRGEDLPYVSRGGRKLEGALDDFALDPGGRVVLDVGASTGGFTDVLLSRGAARIYAIDVGHGQLHARLRSDPRVVLREGVNARLLSRSDVPEECSVLVADVSFISLRLILPAAVPLLTAGADVVLLIKPQFESERGEVGRGGIVRDPEVRRRAVERIVGAAAALGLAHRGTVESPITGADGNVEYLAAFVLGVPGAASG